MANWKIIGSIIGGVLVFGVIGNAINCNNPASKAASPTPRPLTASRAQPSTTRRPPRKPPSSTSPASP
ncbi:MULTISPECIES: hypothetical protein [unclassified Streptomyces]|uniref:hypothetical protein n=1 Tax=unclassified Streptomyces TaxID=2593676 RepID=UPI002254FF88|nr:MULTISPECIES: hypothetical protein [unclassified Streptomyces]MCX4991699.1 hypothetical protein [Streptomyces sp. NBC_00568]MCX5003065.1 hypothetical protein [Streptomyces sp. NBC_00638]